MDQVLSLSKIESVRKTTKFPNFLKVLFFAEMWERFSYYGMRALLVLFLTSKLGFKDERAYAIYSIFAALGYSGPVLAGFLADKLVGFRNMVLTGGIIMVVGHAIMAFVELQQDLIYMGLAFIAIGTGMFKGNISNLLGACYQKDDPERSRGFTLFYVGVNVGSFIASISCSYAAHLYGWNYGFGLAGIGMLIGLVIFYKFTDIVENSLVSKKLMPAEERIFGIRTPYILLIGGSICAYFASEMIIYSELFANVLGIVGAVIFAVFALIILRSSAQQRRNLIALFILIVFFILFFALEMQIGSLINLFTERNVSSEILGIKVPAGVSQAINPLSIIILGAIFGLSMKFKARYSTAIFAFGILTMAICFFVLHIGCLNADSNGKVGYLYLLAGMSFIGLGELCIVPILQAQATLLAPEGLKGFVMGIVMLAAAFANLAGVIVAKFMSVPTVDGAVSSLASLVIYREGFLHIAIFNLGVVLAFLTCYRFVNSVISKQ